MRRLSQQRSGKSDKRTSALVCETAFMTAVASSLGASRIHQTMPDLPEQSPIRSEFLTQWREKIVWQSALRIVFLASQ
jgi:hypothetical protein